MSRVLAIDPGSSQSGFVIYDDEPGPGVSPVVESGKIDNELLRRRLVGLTLGIDFALIEWMQPRGMPTSAQEFETLYWIGRFAEVLIGLGVAVERFPRLEVKRRICGRATANDTNIRHALIDLFGGHRRTAVGVKSAPGPLYGVTADAWQALALAIARTADGPLPDTPRTR